MVGEKNHIVDNIECNRIYGAGDSSQAKSQRMTGGDLQELAQRQDEKVFHG